MLGFLSQSPGDEGMLSRTLTASLLLLLFFFFLPFPEPENFP